MKCGKCCDSVRFSIGVILVRQGAKLDREAFLDPRIELFVVAVDIGGLNSSVPLTVTILDQNDNPPVFNPSSFSVRLPENSPTGVCCIVSNTLHDLLHLNFKRPKFLLLDSTHPGWF